VLFDVARDRFPTMPGRALDGAEAQAVAKEMQNALPLGIREFVDTK
jgi:hypothetical protein